MAIPLLFLLLGNQGVADDSLAKITGQLVKAPITQGVFRQEKHLKFLHKPLVSTGTFTHHESKGVIWKTLAPIPSTLIINDTRLLTGQGEHTLPPAFAKVFKALLGGELNNLSESFAIVTTQQKTGWSLALTPKDELLKKAVGTIHMQGDTEVRELAIQETNGNLTRIRFSEITRPDRLSSEQQADFERLSP